MEYIPEIPLPEETELTEQQRMQYFIAEAEGKGLGVRIKSDSKQVRRKAIKEARKVAAKWKK